MLWLAFKISPLCRWLANSVYRQHTLRLEALWDTLTCHHVWAQSCLEESKYASFTISIMCLFSQYRMRHLSAAMGLPGKGAMRLLQLLQHKVFLCCEMLLLFFGGIIFALVMTMWSMNRKSIHSSVNCGYKQCKGCMMCQVVINFRWNTISARSLASWECAQSKYLRNLIFEWNTDVADLSFVLGPALDTGQLE